MATSASLPSNSADREQDVGPKGSAPVRKCLEALEAAETDTEKLAALFLIPKLVKTVDCDKDVRIGILKGIGFSFLARMLRSKEGPDGCHKLLFQSVALSVLSCFANDVEVMTHPSVLFNVPVFLEIIADADDDCYEGNLLMVCEAYQCLTSIVTVEKGRRAVLSNRGIHFLCRIITAQTFRHEEATKLLLHLLGNTESPWAYKNGAEDFNLLMLKLCQDFVSSQDNSKFEICDKIRALIRSFPRTTFQNEEHMWLPLIKKGLQDILFSKIGKAQRNPAMMLVATVIEVSDLDWCVLKVDDENNDDGIQFFQIICHLACIEVIMCMEDKRLNDEILDDSELLVACYFIIESVVSHMSGKRLMDGALDDNQRLRLNSILKSAFSAIIKFLQDLADSRPSSCLSEDHKAKEFICATVRVLGAWLSEETEALREDVYDVLPFILTTSVETYETEKAHKLSRFTEETFVVDEVKGPSVVQADSLTPDTLRFLLPALCHLVVENVPRRILVNLKLHETLYSYLSYHWTIYEAVKQWLSERECDNGEEIERIYAKENAKFEMTNSEHAITTTCNILMNLAVLEPILVGEESAFFGILETTMRVLSSLEDIDDALVLRGNLCALGLVIVKNLQVIPDNEDLRRFMSIVIKFFWEAHNYNGAVYEEDLGVSNSYLSHWEDLSDLWYFGMQILASVIHQVAWLPLYIFDSGWPKNLLEALSKIPRGGIEPMSTKSSLEELLCSIALDGGMRIHELLKANNVIAVCQAHQLKNLATVISGSIRKQESK